jgi:hypothetical protein
MLFNNAGGISMFGKKKSKAIVGGDGYAHLSGNRDISMIEQTEVITKRDRSEADEAKLEILHALLDVTASEDLDAIFVVVLTEMNERGYKLQDEPGALLERLKRRF